MNYTNGFDIDVVLPALYQRLGWKQPTISGSPVLNTDNLQSKSNRYFNDGSFHSICTIANIYSAQEDPNISDGDFNDFLSTYQQSAIMRALNEVFREKELIEQCLMYTRFGMNDFPIPNSNQWVGWLINVANDQSYSTQITMGTFYFDTNCTVRMYLFQDGVREPLKTIDVPVTAWERTEFDFDSLVLPFKTGQKYYLLYNQAELGAAKGIREQVETFATTRCFEAFPVALDPINDGSYFNHNNKQYPFLPAGVNLEIISFRDHTQRILRKANLFDEVQGLQVAAMALELINNSTRTNLTQRQSEQQSSQLDRALNQAFATNEVPVTPGLKSRIFNEFKRIKCTFFPEQEAMSINQEAGFGFLDTYEQNWIKQNWKNMKNPGVYVST